VQSRQCAIGETAYRREVQQINMEMDDVEIVGLSAYFVQHHQMIGQGVLHGGIESQSHLGQRISVAEVLESPLAKRVTSWP
jgi:hypothetical protein